MQLPELYHQAPIKIAIVAGEASGDVLGAGILKQLKQRYPHASFVGIGGEQMLAEGLHGLYPLERLSVMGFIEPLKRARELLRLRARLKKLFIQNKPDLFIGIDAPDFNLNLEKALKNNGVTTVHYVSPTIWAWRPKRIHKIKKAVSHMLLIFPFEKPLYDAVKVPATFVGHRLAAQYPLDVDKAQAKQALGFDLDKPVIALLIGSRLGEIQRLAKPILDTARLVQKHARVQWVVACHSPHIAKAVQAIFNQYPDLKARLEVGHTSTVLKAADCAIVKSGTSTLDATLAKTPHIVVYKTTGLTYQLAKRLIKTPFISMTNIMAGEKVVDEFIQADCKPSRMAEAVLALLQAPKQEQMRRALYRIHQKLKCDTDNTIGVTLSQMIAKGEAGCLSSQV